jgi:hypothetical protein
VAKRIFETLLLVVVSAALGCTAALAREWVLLDAVHPAHSWHITSQDLGLKIDKPFSVTL